MFIALFGAILRLRNILTVVRRVRRQRDPDRAQTTRTTSQLYLDLYAELRSATDAEKESIIDDVVFEIELIKQVEVNVDYILMLVEKYREAARRRQRHGGQTLAKIQRAIDSSPTLRNKKT